MKKRLTAMILSFAMLMSSSVSAITFGDADGDEKVTVKDAALTMDYVLDGRNIPSVEKFRTVLDMDGSGVIDSRDVAFVLQKALDAGFQSPVEKGEVPPYEPPVEPGSEETPEGTTDDLSDGVISSDHEMNVSSFDTDAYFKKTGDFPPPKDSTAEPRIRMTPDNSIEFTVANGANVYITAKHASTDKEGTRTLTLSGGSFIRSIGYEKGVPYSEQLYGAGLKAGTYKLTADNHIDIKSIRITFDKLEITETTTAVFEAPSEISTTGHKIEVRDFSQLKSALSNTNVDIYVKNDIDCSEALSLSTKNARVNIIGEVQSDGTIPSLDFTTFRNSISKTATGITISGSGYAFENIIVEKAPDCGIRIKNTSSPAGNCFFKNCIFRYNNNSGISMTDGTHDVTFIAVDSYRNGDIVQKCGADADGFSPKLNCGGNIYFYNCRAWDNSDDGWDSFDRGTPYIGSIYYIECLAWNNGNPYVFTGEYDYENNRPLDKDLIYIEQLLKSDPSFEAKYNGRQVTSWPKITMKLLGASMSYDKIHSSSWEGNPNGFKFGSAETPSSSYRYIENCIAFDNRSNVSKRPGKGFDQNNGSARFDIVNGLSFDNTQNYWMDKMTALSQQGTALSFGGEEKDTQKNMAITSPSLARQEELRTTVHKYRDEILDCVYNNKTPGIKLCPVF